MNKKHILLALVATFSLGAALTSCSDDTVDNGGGTPTPPAGEGNTVPGVSAANDYAIVSVTSSVPSILSAGNLNEGAVTAVNNGLQTGTGTAWVFWGNEYLYRLQYNQGNAGVTSSYRRNASGQIEERDMQYNITRFVTYGTWGDNIITASDVDTEESIKTSIYVKDSTVYAKGLGIVYLDAKNETKSTKTVSCENFLGTGEYVTLAGIVEANGKLYTSVVPLGMSQYGVEKYNDKVLYTDLVKTESGGSGSGAYEAGELQWTQYPDEAWVAIYDNDQFENPTLVKTDKISYACGRYRSQYYQTIWPDSVGNVYVFSSSYAKTMSDPRQQTTKPSGIVRIPAGQKAFDNFYFDIEAAAGGMQMYRCWPISGEYFLLQMYTGTDLSKAGKTKLAIFKGGDNPSFTYVTDGIPDADAITEFGTPYAENGIAWIPVVTNDGQQPALYRIDARTATAKRGLEVTASSVSAVGRLKTTD